jgi:1,2-diacylglycerol 3-alpha-glucosyltransferase
MRRHAPDVLHLHNHMFDLAFSAVLEAKTNRQTPGTHHTHRNQTCPVDIQLSIAPRGQILSEKRSGESSQSRYLSGRKHPRYVKATFENPNAVFIPYGISLPPPTPNGLVEKIKSTYGLHDKRVLLSLGHVHAIRNRKDLIEALPAVRKTIPNAVLLIVGAEADSTPRELASRLQIEDSVIFTGPVPHSHVPAYLELAELEAHWLNQEDASRTSLGIASLEAMGSGKAILAAANKTLMARGVLVDGKNLVLVQTQ